MNVFMIISLLVCLFSGLYIVRPFARNDESKSALIELYVWPLMIIAVAVVLYFKVGDAHALDQELIQSDSVASQFNRTRGNPASLTEWNELGRAYLLEQKYVHAYMAYTQSEQLDNNQVDSNTSTGDMAERLKWITGLAEARILAQQGAVDATSHDLVERAIVLSPNNPKVLWYGGLAAAQSGDFVSARSRWEALLGQNPPDALKNVVHLRLDSLWQVKLQIQLDSGLEAKSTPASRVFISLRQPREQPPLVARRVELKDLEQVLVLDIGDTIQGMGGAKAINWDEPVSLSLTWSPTGQAVAEGNIGFSSLLTRDNLDKLSRFSITADGAQGQ